MNQLELEFQESSFRRATEKRWLRLLREIVETRGLSYIAGQLDTTPTYLNHALAGRKRHAVKAEWVPTMLALAPNSDALDFLAELRGMDVVPSKPLSPEEEVHAWREAVSDLPPDFRSLLEGRVRARKKRS